MLLLKPVAHETIWGGARLKEFCESQSNQIGHLYSLYDQKGNPNIILNGTWKGSTIHDYFVANKERFHLAQYDYFPIIVAMVEAKEHLSIQVHPDDEAAVLLTDGEKRGKNESWFFLETPKEGSIYCGCSCGTLAELKGEILSGNIAKVTNRLPVQKGDYVYVTGGTLHAMTAGSFVYEIEENADATYRFYDFDRVDETGNKRELHISNAFFAIDVEKESKVRHYDGNPIEERLYSTCHYEKIDCYENTSDTLEVVTFLSDSSELEGVKLRFGTSIVLEPKESISFGSAQIMVAQPR
ncbi:MAG: type I phosphomannose isomerase catalytic subunit [Eubacteriales bacterium]